MKREILFRGRTPEGEWVYGNLFNKHKLTEVGKVFWCFLIHDGALTSHVVNPETVGQFTGLFDKKKVKIFEGDILRADSWKFKWIVQFDITRGRFNCVINKEGSQNDFIPTSMVKVIGNIHEPI